MYSKKNRIIIIIATILIILIGGISFGYYSYKRHDNKKAKEVKNVTKTCQSTEHNLKLEYIFEIKDEEISKITFRESFIYENVEDLNMWVTHYEQNKEYTIDKDNLRIYKEEITDKFEANDLRIYNGYKNIYERNGFTCDK